MTPERFGNYTLLRPLGRGGMAEVFLARAPSIGGFEKLVAIKRLLPPFNSDRQITSMLGDEARLSVWLNHPNVVQILDFGRVDKTYFIAMEYVEGCDLCDLIRPKGESPGRPLPLPTALYVMALVAEALAYAHRRCHPESGAKLKIIHRDVSPHNVLISTEGQVKLADFGLARASISVHQSFAGVIRGKFSYMPKEQAHGHDIDHRIDLFAAGVTLYEALTGVKPYTSTTLAQQLYQLEQPIPPPSAHVADIPEEIDDLTMEALCPDPEERYQSADDLAADLRSALLKLSTFGQEEKQLTALVKSALAGRELQHHHQQQPLPRMSLADIPVTDDNLIGEELLTLQKTHYPERSSSSPARSAPPANEVPDLSDDLGEDEDEDEDADTKQFMKAGASRARSESFDRRSTLARRSAPPRGSETAGVAGATAGSVPAPASTEMPPELPDEITDEFPSAFSDGQDDLSASSESDLGGNEPPEALPPVAGSLEFSSPDLPSPSPFDTLQDPEEAGQRARQALEEMRTLQRSPEEALAAFERALDKRAPKVIQQRRLQLSWKHWSAVGAGAFVVFSLGLILGYSLKRPADPRAMVRCPEPKRCPACPGPTTTPLPVQTKPLDVGVEPKSQVASDDAEPRVVAVRTRPAEKPKTVRRPPRPRPRTRPAGKRPPANSGYLAITADAKAKAYIDDRRFAAPVPIRLPLGPGIHTVRVLFVETNHWSSTKWVTIQTGKTQSVFFSSLE